MIKCSFRSSLTSGSGVDVKVAVELQLFRGPKWNENDACIPNLRKKAKKFASGD